MAIGFAKDGAEQLEVEAVIQAGIIHARKQFNNQSESLLNCEECGKIIPEARRIALKGCRTCVECQTTLDTIFKREPRNCWHRSMR